MSRVLTSRASAQLSDFRPEQLLGQLKAEQRTRNDDAAVQFIHAVLGVELDSATLKESLRDGVVLCQLINALCPGIVKRINTKSLPFAQMENISNFLEAAGKLGLQSTDLFQTVDLYEGKNMPRVIMTLLTIARVVAGIPLNSHRKSVDLTQRSSSDAWNSTATLGMKPTMLSSRHTKHTQKNESALRAKLDAPQTKATAVRVHAGSHRSRTDRRRSKRRSATTLFLAETIKPTAAAAASSRTINNTRAQTKNVSNISAIVESISGNRQSERVPSEPRASGADRRQQKNKAPEACMERVANLSKTLVRSDVPDPSVLAEPTDSEEKPLSSSLSSSSPPPPPPSPPSLLPSENSDQAMDTLAQKPDDVPELSDKQQGSDADLPVPVPRPRKRGNGGEPQKERLTVYSEAAQRLTNYQLGNCIGRGQFGAVYRALDLETGQMVAVKQISIEGQNADDMEDVMGEVDLLKSLSSPRIVRYHGFVKTDTHLNLVMEYVENGSLSATLKSFGSFPEKLVLAYVVKIIQGLTYLHARDVVHCDLKACNILTTKKGNTKLTDFGVSLNLKLRKPGDESVVAGTPYWMAPEIIMLDGACRASDIWSLGCTIIELLTGKPPYADLMQMQAMYRIVEDDHPPIPEGISEELKDFLMLCFKKDPVERPTAPQLMEHAWTAQYRSNRREMKMLRRTCSRKMTVVMANKLTDLDYPTFNAAVLNSHPMMMKKRGGDVDIPETIKEFDDDDDDDDDDEGEEADDSSDTGEPIASRTLRPSDRLKVDTQGVRSADEDLAISAPLDTPTGTIGRESDYYPDTLARPGSILDFEDTLSDTASMQSNDETDLSPTTFEGPRVKMHRLRTILCDAHATCQICRKALTGAFIQCSSCKIRCHDACTPKLQPCSSMRMSRFLFPASRKSSKRFESRSPNLRLRARRVSNGSAASAVPAVSAQASVADTFSSAKSRADSAFGSSNSSLNMAKLSQSILRLNAVTDGFDGTMSVHDIPPQARAQSFVAAGGADSGWETDETDDVGSQPNRLPQIPTAHPLPQIPARPRAAHMQPRPNSIAVLEHPGAAYQLPQQPNAAFPLPQQPMRVSIPASRASAVHGPFSAPLGADQYSPISATQAGTAVQMPKYYAPLSATGAMQPLSESLPHPHPLGRMRAFTASLENLSGGGASKGRSATSFLERIKHPLRSSTSSEFKAVAGFSPGAAQRAKRQQFGSNASVSDLASATTSEMFSRSEVGLPLAENQCMALTGRALKHTRLRRKDKECSIM